MILDGRHTRSIARTEDGQGIRILDQRQLPWEIRWVELRSLDAAAVAIREMWTRGAPMIGANLRERVNVGGAAGAIDQ